MKNFKLGPWTIKFRSIPAFILLCSACLVVAVTDTQAQEPVNKDDFLVKKGRMYGTLTFSLDQRLAENENQLLRFVQDQDRLNYRIIGGGGYAIQDNLTLGLGLGYGRQREEITFENEDGELITAKSLEQGLSIAPNLRTFVPLGKGRLQVLVQTELNITFGEFLERDFGPTDIDKIEGNFLEASLGVSPGAVLFFDRNWAFEVTVGLAGLSTRIEEEVLNDDEDNRQRVVETGVDLQINLLRLNLGIAYYL